ncbi:MAG: hypothetical protein EXQ94_07965 [Alphaproteobacteria bacterium]|nr:hypothetical protein [Alphaproteobacteria bacterium]
MDHAPPAKAASGSVLREQTGKEPVRDWLKSLPLIDRKTIGRDIATIEYRWPVGMPLCRPLGGGLWEVRCTVSKSETARRMRTSRSQLDRLLNPDNTRVRLETLYRAATAVGCDVRLELVG